MFIPTEKNSLKSHWEKQNIVQIKYQNKKILKENLPFLTFLD